MRYTIEDWENSINEYSRYIPHYMIGGVKRYVFNGVPMGDFADKIFRNDFMGAANYADNINLKNLDNWARFMVNALPHMCYGSPEKVDDWMEQGGLIGMLKEETHDQ